jgi:hypothetical protein
MTEPGSTTRDARNPYAPPNSEVADAPSAPAYIPSSVLRACTLIWVGYGLLIVTWTLLLMRNNGALPRAALALGILVGAIVALLIVRWVTSRLRAGRNWMRLLYTAIFLLGAAWAIFSPGLLARTFSFYAPFPLLVVIPIFRWLLSAGAAVLLNTHAARSWFAADGRPAE